MNRRRFAAALLFAPLALRATTAQSTLRGKLHTSETPKIDNVALTGDDATKGVLNDPRLDNSDFEVLGHYTDPTHFDVDKIHTPSLFVHKDGKRLVVTYWCDVCYIRTYTPGKCWCCQKDTDLDLRETLSE